MKKATIGIDLGTTNSCVSVMENGIYKIIPNSEGHNTTPSVVGFSSNGEKLVGQIAKRQAVTNPTKTIFGAKRLIGRKYNDPEVQHFKEIAPFKIVEAKNGDAWIDVDGKAISPIEVSGYILGKMKKAAEDYLGYEVEDCVITVPSYFGDAQKKATKDAGTIAGLNVKRIINEPTSAILAYGYKDQQKQRVILVTDAGGGTIDGSVIEVSDDGIFEVKSTSGDTFLGGEDFDYRIINWMNEEFKKQTGVDLKNDNMALQRLKEAAEKAKHELSSVNQTDINLPFISADSSGPKHLNLTLTRSKFESLIQDLLERVLIPIRTCIKDSGYKLEEINEVILVGGSTRIPKLQQMIKDLCKQEPNKSVNPDEIVAAGAAVQGGILAGDVKDVLLLDVTPLSLGLETMGGVFTKIIEKNTTIPVKKSQIFSTAIDNQPAVSIVVGQGEREFAKDNKSLGKFDLSGIAPAPRGVPQIEVTFDIDANGIVHVTAQDKATGKSQEIRITGGSGLSDDEIKRMVREAEENRTSDQARRKVVDHRNQLDGLLLMTEKMLKENAQAFNEEDTKKLNEVIISSRAKLTSENFDEIDQAIKDLEKVAHEMSAKMQGSQQGPGSNDQGSSQGTQKPKDDDAIDAEYKAV